MQRMFLFKKSIFGFLGLCCGQIAMGQGIKSGTQKPFTLSGSVGASANFYSSDETVKTRPTFAWNLYGNMVGRTGKWTLPLSFVVNQFNNSNASPYIQAGISPTYQWARFHLGYRYIPFSPLTFEGQSFRGVGVELNPKNFRFAAFYGRLNKAINEDTARGRFRAPQFSRKGYGIKVGIGNERRYFDLLYFHAKDDSSSANLIRPGLFNSLRAQENAVIGPSFRLTIAKQWVWTGDAAVSGLIQDQAGKRRPDTANQRLRKFIGHFLPTNSTLTAHYAAQSLLRFYTRIYNGSIGYRRVQPGFKSLGTPYMLDDVELLSLINNVSALKGKINIGTNVSQQHNNLDRSRKAETRTRVGNLNVNTILTTHLNINANVSGYAIKQRNDRNNFPDSLRLNDSFLVHQQIAQYGFSPSYNMTKGNNIHFVNGNITYQTLKDKNARTAPQTNSNNLSTSLTYTLAFINVPYSISVNYLYSRFRQTANSYKSNGGTLSLSAQLLKNRNWNLQGSFGYFINRFNNAGKQKNSSYSASTSYQAKHHALNLFANYIYTPPNNPIADAISQAIPYAVASKYLFGGVSYTYTFY